MDHDGQIETEGRMTSQDHADNLSKSEILSIQPRNLNETKKQTHLQNAESFIQQVSLTNNGNVVEKGREGWDEEDDFDEVMKEEEEESEGSSCLIGCQSPDNPTTDSSFSETGSLLETPYPLSPGTSPEPTSPVTREAILEVAHPISLLELSEKDADVKSHILNTGSGDSAIQSTSCAPTLVDRNNQTTTSSTWFNSPTECTDVSDKKAKNFSADLLTSATEPVVPPCGSLLSDPETLVFTKSNTSTDVIPEHAEPLHFTTKPKSAGTDLPASSNQGPVASGSVITSNGSISTPALLQSLEELIQRGDDSHLPQYLHQIAEAFVLCEDYQRALRFVQLERLYHQRVLDNLNTLQKHWEGRCDGTSSDLVTPNLDTLKHICQTHTRPRTKDAEQPRPDLLRPKSEEDSQRTSNAAHQVDRGMEQKSEDCTSPVIPSENLPESLNSVEAFEKERENPSRAQEGKSSLNESQLTDEQGRDGAEEEGGAECTTLVREHGLHPPTAVAVDQSEPAEQQKQDSGPGLEKEAKGEEEVSDVEEATEALEMEDEEAEDEAEEQRTGRETRLPVETLTSGAEVEAAQINQDASGQQMLLNETQKAQANSETGPHAEARPPQETHTKQIEEDTEEKEEDWDYDRDQADIIREASSLDNMAKLITVEEISPASGLVSILKKQSVYVESCVPAVSEPRPKKATAKRRVRFKVPDDNYENEIGGGDSCLLLFLLCLVTVVISVGGTAFYCAFGDKQSSVCQDFTRNADFYIGQLHRGMLQIQHWFTPGS